MSTVARVSFVALISGLHLISIVLLTLSLKLGSGGLVQSAALCVDWLALIVMGIFFLHRARFPQREYIRPRSIIAFWGLTFFSAVNLTVLSVRLATGDRGLVRDFHRVGNAKATAGTVVSIAAVSTLLGMIGAYISHTGCYVEQRRKVPKPLISWPVHDWRPFPAEAPMGMSMPGLHDGPRKYIPGVIPAFRGEGAAHAIFRGPIATRKTQPTSQLAVPGGYQDMASMRKSFIAGGRGAKMNMYVAGPNGSTFELVPPPPVISHHPSSTATKGGRAVSAKAGPPRGRKGEASRSPQPPPPVAKGMAYQGRRSSALVTYI